MLDTPTKNFEKRCFPLFTNGEGCDKICLVRGALAQLVAHNTGSVGVSGSNPLCSTKKISELDKGSDIFVSTFAFDSAAWARFLSFVGRDFGGKAPLSKSSWE